MARMLISAGTTSQILQFASDEWGITRRQAETYPARARQQVRNDYSQDRDEFLATRLGLLDAISQKALESGQLSAAVGSARLQAELAQML